MYAEELRKGLVASGYSDEIVEAELSILWECEKVPEGFHKWALSVAV